MQLGADFLATGHYCQTNSSGELLKGYDLDKDQTYFLYTVQSKVLSKVLFPVGHLPKAEVRRIALEAGLATAQKKDSTGICFIGKRDFKEFISQYIPYQKGPFLTLEGNQVGEHMGMAYYTIGQRKGLGIGGEGDAWFVVDKDPKANIVYVVQGEDHPALYSTELIASDLSWVSGTAPCLPFTCKAKIRYRHQEQACTLYPLPDEKIHVKFSSPQRAVTLRQSIVFYQENLCLGGGMIFQRKNL
jgi:tRNA-specific 2-thiouridylase